MYDSIYSPWNTSMNYEEKKIEHERWRSLTPQQRHEEWEAFIKKTQEEADEKEVKKMEAQEERSKKEAEWLYIHAEKPHSLDNGEATVSWIIVMLVGTIFNARWLIWIVATFIYLNHIFRYQIRKWKWDNGGKEEYYQKNKRCL